MSLDGVTGAVLRRFRFLFRDFLLSKFFTVGMYIYAFRDCIPRWRYALCRCITETAGRNGVGHAGRQKLVF